MLSGWERTCLEFDQIDSIEAAESLYRVAHNLKSGSAAVGLGEFNVFVHHVEDLLSRLVKGSVKASPQFLRLMLDIHTLLTTWIMNLRSDTSHIPKDSLNKLDAEVVGFGSQSSETAASLPPVEAVVTEEAAAIAPVEVETPVTTAQPPTAQAQEPVFATSSPSTQPPVGDASAHGKQARQNESMRVSAVKLDKLIQIVGELSTQQAIVWHGWQNGTLASKSCDNAIQLIQKSSKELQSLALSLRMQTLQSLFQRLERTAKELALKQGKKVVIETAGDHVELDKTVIDHITEPLIHVIRNAIDHGIETPEDRLAQGKPEAATLKLMGSQEPGGILITVSEDGRGLNLDKILSKALEKGLARPDQKYTPAEIQRFIFLHGFSTAEKISDVSGRGVGMDIVKTSVQSIGGSIGINSAQGKGTAFSINLPTTLSIIDALIIHVEDCCYAVPVQDVAEILDLKGLNIKTAATQSRLLSLRQRVIPVEYLKDHLPVSTRKGASGHTRTDSILPALVIRSTTDSIAFQVDAITGQQPVSVRPLPGGLGDVPGYTGGTILGNGDPCIILNLSLLMQSYFEEISEPGRSGGDVGPQSQDSAFVDSPESRHLVFTLGEFQLATPLLSIREILSDLAFSKVLTNAKHVLGCIDVRGQVLSVISLGGVLGIEGTTAGGPLIVIQTEQSAIAIAVDKVDAVSDLNLVPMPLSNLSKNGQRVAEALGVSGMVRFKEQMIPSIDLQQTLERLGRESLESISTYQGQVA